MTQFASKREKWISKVRPRILKRIMKQFFIKPEPRPKGSSRVYQFNKFPLEIKRVVWEYLVLMTSNPRQRAKYMAVCQEWFMGTNDIIRHDITGLYPRDRFQ